MQIDLFVIGFEDKSAKCSCMDPRGSNDPRDVANYFKEKGYEEAHVESEGSGSYVGVSMFICFQYREIFISNHALEYMLTKALNSRA